MKSWIPNFFTSANLGVGVLCIMLASQGDLKWAALCILGSLIADSCDGRSARALGVSGEFGKEMDSLADVVSFGVASGYLMYAAALHTLGWIGMAATILYAVFGGLRLARFNTNAAVIHGYFMGVPIPTGGCLFATYVLSGVQFPPALLAVIVVCMGYLLVSKVHNPDFKSESPDKLHKSALAIAVLIGLAGLLLVDWHLIYCLPFALYVLFGLINTAMNSFGK